MFGFFRITRLSLFKNPKDLAKKCYSNKLTQQETTMVKDSWLRVKPKAKAIGETAFTGLFKTYPHYAGLFKKFGDEEFILDSDEFILHTANVVLASFGQAVMALGDPCKLQFVKEIGRKHIQFDVQVEHFKNFKPFLIDAIMKHSCEMDCNLNKAWDKATDIIILLLIQELTPTP